MSVTLDKPLKREVAIDDDRYTLTIAPEGLKLVPKGRRKGVELQWRDLVSGQAALAASLNASLERIGDWDAPRATESPPPPARSRRRAAAAKQPRRRR